MKIRKWNRILAVALSISLLAAGMAGCSGQDGAQAPGTSGQEAAGDPQAGQEAGQAAEDPQAGQEAGQAAEDPQAGQETGQAAEDPQAGQEAGQAAEDPQAGQEAGQEAGQAAPMEPFVYEPIDWDADMGTEEYTDMFDASEAQTTGNVRLETKMKGYTGEGYLTGFEEEQDSCSFTVEVPQEGSFDIHIVSAGLGGEKINNVGLDGNIVGSFTTPAEEFSESVLQRIYMEAGEHTISIQKSWGWIALDSLAISSSKQLPGSTFQVEGELINPNATDRAQRLMHYLKDMYGSYVLSGQFADKGLYSPEIIAIQKVTGDRLPAILGLDFMNYSPTFAEHGATADSVDRAIEYDALGGIVTFCWHWGAPEKYHKEGATWYRTFYADQVDMDLEAILDGEDEEGYELILRDIDAIAEQIAVLQEADVPILFRPLHEASGGWFWWGAYGPECCKRLWKLLYDRLTNYHGLNNLIWVWNGQSADWYPGDEYVDIIGEDLYPGNHVYSSQSGKFCEAVEYPETSKIVAMTENGCLFDPDLAFRDQAPWAWFCTWSGEFVVQGGYNILSEEYTEEYMVEKVYTHERVITLDELPDLKTYEGMQAQ